MFHITVSLTGSPIFGLRDIGTYEDIAGATVTDNKNLYIGPKPFLWFVTTLKCKQCTFKSFLTLIKMNVKLFDSFK